MSDSGRSVFLFWPEGSRSVGLPPLGTVTIGRAPTCTIAVNHDSVSRVHAALHVTRGEIAVEDLGSSNGTRISGKKLIPYSRIAIEPGTLVELGVVTLVVQGSSAIGAPDANDIPTPPRTMPVAPIESSTMERLDQLVAIIAKSHTSVLILGEPGVGKKTIGERIHRESSRASAPLVNISCPEASVADLEKKFAEAQKSTIFLDEIGSLDAAKQSAVMRLLEAEGSDVRVLSSTNRDLAKLVIEDAFREDLHTRLNGLSLTIPALRDRVSDIPDLAEKFVQDACNRLGIPVPRITELALADLTSRAWPGNVRELRAVIEHAVKLADGRAIDVAQIAMQFGSETPPLGIEAAAELPQK